MYVYGVDDYPVLLFADAFLGGECVTWTSRYRSDGRENYDFSKLTVRFQLHGIGIFSIEFFLYAISILSLPVCSIFLS